MAVSSSGLEIGVSGSDWLGAGTGSLESMLVIYAPAGLEAGVRARCALS